MNIKFEQLLQSLGLTVADVSHSLKERINQFYTVKTKYDNSKEELKSYEGDDLAEATSTVESVGTMLSEMDDELVVKITKWYSKRDQYAQQAEKLQASRDNKKAANGGAIANATIPVPAGSNQGTAAASAPVASTGGQAGQGAASAKPASTEPIEVEAVEEKEKSGFGWLEAIGLAVVGIVTLGIVSSYQKK